MNPTTDHLTAYALGEGSATERIAIAAYLATDSAAQAEVAAIREAATLISDSLLQESAPGLDQARKDALATLTHSAPVANRLRFSTWLGVIATGAVAAGIAVAVLPETGTNTGSGERGAGCGNTLMVALDSRQPSIRQRPPRLCPRCQRMERPLQRHLHKRSRCSRN